MKSNYTLKDFEELAYEFAIRNPRVIELLHQEPTEQVANELLTFGINITRDIPPSDFNNEVEVENTFDELFLDYSHLQDLNHIPFSYKYDDFPDDFKGRKVLSQPVNRLEIYALLGSKIKFEDDITALKRINTLIETKKLNRLMSKEVFDKHYDYVTFKGYSIYRIDPTTNTRKTIKSDIYFVKEWINPKKYLQLLPQQILF